MLAPIGGDADSHLRKWLAIRKSGWGAIAQLGERLICIQEVVGSIPSGSTIFLGWLDRPSLLEWSGLSEKETFFHDHCGLAIEPAR